MEIPQEIWMIGSAALLAVLVLLVIYIISMRRVKLIRGGKLYDHDPDERLASPFAEQVEDILHARLSADPVLAAMDVDLGTAPDGGLEIWVDGERYTDIDLVPNERLRQAMRRAIESWERATEG